MDFDADFDNDDPDATGADYERFVASLSARTADDLRAAAAAGDRDAVRRALRRYFARGARANLTTAELIDFLAVSTPSILEAAGYDEAAADDALALVAALTEDEITSGEAQ